LTEWEKTKLVDRKRSLYKVEKDKLLNKNAPSPDQVEILDPTFDDAPLPGQMEGIESATIVSLSS
jgi:hypothetical protein